MIHSLRSEVERATDLVALLQVRANRQPDEPAYIFLPDGETEKARLTYAELAARARGVAMELQRIASPGDRVLLVSTSSPHFLSAFFGCLCADVIPVPIVPPRPHRHIRSLDAIARNAGPSLVIAEEGAVRVTRDWCRRAMGMHSQSVWVANHLESPAQTGWSRPDIDGKRPAYLQYTSGTTAGPRGVMITHDCLLHNCAEIAANMALAPDDLIVSWLPLFHDMGLLGQVIFALYIGKPCVLMPPATFSQRPVRWLQAISRFRGTISFAPNSAYDACVHTSSPRQRSALDLSSWRVALNGAEQVRAHTLKRFTDAFAGCGFQSTAFYPAYGLAEATLRVSGGPPGIEPITLDLDAAALEEMQVIHSRVSPSGSTRTLVACGEQHGGTRVAIVDPSTRLRCPDNVVGEIWICGPGVAAGYWEQSEESARVFQARIAQETSGPFLRSGDLGFVDCGNLYITGRIKDLIVINGRNLCPSDIEYAVERSHPSIQRGSVAAFAVERGGQEDVAVLFEVTRAHRNRMEPEGVIASVRRAIAEACGIPCQVIGILPPGAMPCTSSGKVMRRACRKAYLDGDVPFIAHREYSEDAPGPFMPILSRPGSERVLHAGLPPERRRKVAREIIAEEVARLTGCTGPRKDDDGFAAMGLDSLRLTQLAYAICGHLPPTVPCTAATLFERGSVGALADELAEAVCRTRPNLETCAWASDPGYAAGDVYRASIGQERLWFLEQWAPHQPMFNLPVAMHLPRDRACADLRQAIAGLVDHHEVLRTVSIHRNGHLFLHVREPGHHDLLRLHRVEEGTSRDALATCVRTEVQRPFDLAHELPCRFLLIDTGASEWLLVMTVHHSAADAISLNLLTEQLLDRIESGSMSRSISDPPMREFGEYAHCEHRWSQSEAARKDLRYWRKQLEGARPLELPCDRPRPPIMSHRGASVPVTLGPDIIRNLLPVCRREGVTPFMYLVAAFSLVLARYSAQTDVSVGSPVSVRPSARFGSTPGHFVNMLTLRIELDQDWTVHDLLRHVRNVAGKAYLHQLTPFDQVVRHLNPSRDPGRTPLFQAVLSLQPNPNRRGRGWAPDGVATRDLRPDLGVAQFDLTLDLVRTSEGMKGFIEYNTDLFDAWRIRQFAGHFQTCLRGLMSDPDSRLVEMDILTEPERTRLLLDRNATTTDRPGDRCLPMLIAERAAQHPGAVAVQCGDLSVTYAELLMRVHRLASDLRRTGVERGSLVGICMERSIEMVVSILAVLQAGGAYIPMDPKAPPRRLGTIIDDASPLRILADAATVEMIRAVRSTPIHVAPPIQVELEGTDDPGAFPPADAIACHDVAYVIYTSGSAGTPKGVLIEHGSLVNLLQAIRHPLGIGAEDALLAVTTISFDIAALELLLPLISGGRLVVATRSVASDGIALAEELSRTGATIMQATPATWRMLLISGRLDLPHLTALCGGEALPVDLARQIRAKVGQLWNLYGPTETTIWSTWHRVLPTEEGARKGPYELIGKPLANTRLYVLDPHGRPVPDGIRGELYIGGAGVARGYLNQPDLTAERFVADPFHPGHGCLFRTGDLVRYLPDGEIEFLGRADRQVKVRGTRVEPGEVEAALCELPDVEQAVVLARADRTGENELVAYIHRGPGQETDAGVGALRRHLLERLPEYMIPNRFVFVPAFPMTPHGKLDGRALSNPEESAPSADGSPSGPDTELEQMVAGIWAGVLGISDMGTRQNFFDLGGHSLLLVQVQAELVKRGFPGISVVDLFRCPTVQALSSFLDGPSQNAGPVGTTPRLAKGRTLRNAVAGRQRARRERATGDGIGPG